MKLNAKRIRWPEWVAGVGGLVLLGAMLLLPWFTLTTGTPPPGPQYFVSSSIDGWHGLSHAHWLLLVTILVAFALVYFQAASRAPAVPVTLSLFTALLGGATTLWLIVRVVIDPPGGREIGGWIGLIAAAAITYGGYKSLQLEGIAPSDAPAEIPTVRLGDVGGS